MRFKTLFFFQLVLMTFLMLNFNSCESKKSDNPLLDTQWTGLAKIPEDAEVILKFSNNKLDVLFGNKIIETMTYSLNNGEITLVKNSGGTPCNAGATGKYKYEIIGENLVMTFISDECDARVKSLQGVVYKKVDAKK